MKMPNEFSELQLAPCGMNCALCYVYLRKKKPCSGCRGVDEAKPDHCRVCKIKDCLAARGHDFCHECASFPCILIKNMDKSYQKRYQISLMAMTQRHKTLGAGTYLKEEKIKWLCAECGGVLCMHDKICSECGKVSGREALSQ
jgi:hypothetical protein